MDKLESTFEKLDKLAKTQPKLVEVCKQYGVRPAHVLAGLGVAVGLMTILLHGYSIICACLTCVYPMIQSISAIEDPKDEVK